MNEYTLEGIIDIKGQGMKTEMDWLGEGMGYQMYGLWIAMEHNTALCMNTFISVF